MKRLQQGFGLIAVIVILVILAALAGAIVSFGSTQQITSAQDVLATRAWQASKAGNEWGIYFALKSKIWPAAGSTCDTAAFGGPVSETLDLSVDTGFRVKVSCESKSYNEGECALADTDSSCVISSDPTRKVKQVRIYRITSVACSSASCPAADASSIGYVERTRVVLVTN